MTRASTRTNFHSSTLLRCLADLGLEGIGESGEAFAEKLGMWVHFADAIALSAVHSAGGRALPVRPAASQDERTQLRAEFDRVQTMLVNSITKSCSLNPGRVHIRLPAPDFDLPLKPATAYPPYRRFYEAHQRDMELGLQPLRVNLRDAVAKASPGLKKLAELDATLEKILRERENRLLARVPVLLRQRFEHLYKAHQQALAGAEQDDKPARWMQAGGWLARFCGDMRTLLLAELELRLQPALGLIEAYEQHTQ
ncbi:DUF3348 family protein [Oxalobacteraceae bacterium OM1]|nr:DUF3348 family protein [Oxalobacteraceae bacterium OM1]